MPRNPLLALTAAVALSAAVSIIASPNPTVAYAEVPPAPPLPDSPPSTAYVLAGAVEASALTEFEEELTEQARERATSTTTTTPIAPVEAVVENAETPQPPPEPKRSTPTTTSTTSTTTSTTSTTTEPPEEGSIDFASESDFVGRINSLRSSNGKEGLTRDGSLDARARDWARHMAESGSLAHSNLGSLMPPWTAVAENLGQGGSVSQVFDLLAGSSGHLSNMLGDYTHLGVGVWRDANGVLWTAHVFAR